MKKKEKPLVSNKVRTFLPMHADDRDREIERKLFFRPGSLKLPKKKILSNFAATCKFLLLQSLDGGNEIGRLRWVRYRVNSAQVVK